MMRIRPISSTVTLLMAAIVFGAPLIVNLVIGAMRSGMPQPDCAATICPDKTDLASAAGSARPLQR
ncbi:MAG TPA: hypothetical protein VG942_03965 [Hyphomonadaceae bacterium]|nr:hypothetical protein [Hyphomonadaceae bacterium]